MRFRFSWWLWKDALKDWRFWVGVAIATAIMYANALVAIWAYDNHSWWILLL